MSVDRKAFSSVKGISCGVLPAIGKIVGGSGDVVGRAGAIGVEKAHDFFVEERWAHVGDLNNDGAALTDECLTSVMNGMRQRIGSSPVEGYKESEEPENPPQQVE